MEMVFDLKKIDYGDPHGLWGFQMVFQFKLSTVYTFGEHFTAIVEKSVWVS